MGRHQASSPAEGFIDWVEGLVSSIGLGGGLEDLGIEVTDELLNVAQTDVCNRVNPLAVDREGFRSLFEAAM